MAYIGNVVTSFNVATQNINNDAITTEKIADGAILNADVNSAAAIAGTKISPDFGSQNIATTGLFSHALGTAAAPTITFTGDPNTGIYSPGADQVAISTNGARRLLISNGQIQADTLFSVAMGGAGFQTIFRNGANEDNYIAHGASGFTAFRNHNGSEYMRLDSAGRLGLGTSSPGDRLQVDGNGLFFGNIGSKNGIAVGVNSSYTWYVQRENVSTGRLEFNVVSGGGSPTTRMVLTESGQLGIGTTSPNRALEVNAQNGVNTTSVPALRLKTGNTAGAAGYGTGIDFTIQASNNVEFVSARIESTYTDITNQFGDVRISTMYAGTLSEKLRIDPAGRLLVGTSTDPTGGDTNGKIAAISGGPGGLYIGRSDGDTSADRNLAQIVFRSFAGSAWESAASIQCFSDNTSGSGDKPGRLVFSTTADGASSPTERMRITQEGNVMVGKTTNAGFVNSTGVDLGSAGYAILTRSGEPPLFVNRQTNDGDLVRFFQDNNLEGAISVSGSTVTYGGGHLARWSQLPNEEDPSGILKGTVMSNLDEMCEWGEEDNEQLNRTKVSDVEGDPNVAGVFVSTSFTDDGLLDFYCAMTGDMIIRIAESVTVQRGDLLMSAGDGTAKPQGDGFVQDKTIAKVTSTHVTCTYDDGSYCVPCVLMAC